MGVHRSEQDEQFQ